MAQAFCVYCGKKIEDTDLYCEHCGKSAAPASRNAGTPPDSLPPSAASCEPPANPGPERPRSIKPFVAVSCATVAVLLVAGGALLWRFLQNGDRPPSATPGSSATSISQGGDVQTTSVPDLSGRAESDARKAVEDAGLTIGALSEEYSSTVGKGSIISQTPAAGTSVQTGSKVNFAVSKGARPAIVHTYEAIAKPLTWTEAKAYCESKGGYLACISSEDEYNAVLSTAKGLEQKVFWLGGYRDKSSDAFKWIDGSPITYTAWASGEPNDDEGVEDCLALFDVNGTWGWYDAPNDLSPTYQAKRRGFIMEREIEQPAT